MLGILLIDKPKGITSHDVVNVLRRKFSTKRVGHAGTLDPLGTGLLVVAVGPATRFLQYLSLEPKEYVCTIRFGLETTTQDSEGEPVSERELPADLSASISSAIPRFLGLIEQIPPMYSAVKKDGRPLYEYARKGIEVERRSRKVHIDEIAIIGVTGGSANVRVVCSGGTYVRTLAHDLGGAIGCGAHLTALQRTGAGRFQLDDAVALDEVGADNVMPLPEALAPMPILQLGGDDVAAIRQGRAVAYQNSIYDGYVGLIDETGNIVGVARSSGATMQPECVLPVGVGIDP